MYEKGTVNRQNLRLITSHLTPIFLSINFAVQILLKKLRLGKIWFQKIFQNLRLELEYEEIDL